VIWGELLHGLEDQSTVVWAEVLRAPLAMSCSSLLKATKDREMCSMILEFGNLGPESPCERKHSKNLGYLAYGSGGRPQDAWRTSVGDQMHGRSLAIPPSVTLRGDWKQCGELFVAFRT
jgi:hypothetical protein